MLQLLAAPPAPPQAERTGDGPTSGAQSLPHQPVLQQEVVDLLVRDSGGHFLDATVGAGGHAAAILAAAPQAHLLGIDTDPAALAVARATLAPFAHRVRLTHANFRDLAAVACAEGWPPADGILFDLGMSSMQLADDRRGFSFASDGPLDLRFDPSRSRVTAADLIAQWREDELAAVLRRYGEERWARRIARAVVEARRRAPLRRAADLAALVARVVPSGQHGPGKRLHPATRTFQALRIAVNDELCSLAAALPQALSLLRPGGRLVTISFHSLEDRLVKRVFRRAAGACQCPPGLPVCACGARAEVRLVRRRVVTPRDEERRRNPRSRSARLRVVARIAPVP